MLRHLFIYCFALHALLVSCYNHESKHLAPNIEIESKELKDAIIEYDSILHHNPDSFVGASNCNYLLTVYEHNINDSVTKYVISFCLDTWHMQDNPTWLADIGGKYVVIYPSNNYRGIFSTSKELHREIARRWFPKEYEVLIKERPLYCSVLNDSPSMILTFVKGELISKRISKGI